MIHGNLLSPGWHLHTTCCGLQGSGQNGATTLSRSVKLGIDYIIPRDDLELGAPWSVGVDCQECLGVWCGVEVIARQYFDWEYGTAWHTTDDGEVWVNNLGLLERAGWNVLQVRLSKGAAQAGQQKQHGAYVHACS